MIKTAVVILNWNGEAMLRQFLPSVIACSRLEGTEIYVADNASTDASCEVVEKEFPSVHLIRLDKNYGFADGYNYALQKIDAEYVVLLNSDVEVTEGWLQPMVDYLDTHPETVACQPKIRAYRHRNLFEYAGASGGFIDRYGYPFCRGRVFESVEEDKGQYDEVIPVLWATGSFDDSSGRISECGGTGRTFLCTHGRNRLVLAFTQSRLSACLYSFKYGISCGRGYLEKGKSP